MDATLDDAIAILDAHLKGYPNTAILASWAVVRGAARRGRRVSLQTLPRIADIAQHAVAIREAIDQLVPALPVTLYHTVVIARDHVLVILDALRTGAEDNEPPESPEET